jgi:hypothetical protein
MVATTAIDLIVVIAWIGGVTLLLLVRALVSWRRFRNNSNFALQARRLHEATRLAPAPQVEEPSEGEGEGEVIPLHRRPTAATGS